MTEIDSHRSRIVGELAIFGGIFSSIALLILFGLLKNGHFHFASFMMILMQAYFIAAIPWGWSALGSFTSNVFLILPVFGWVFYLTIKVVLSMFVGGVTAPVKIYRNVMELKSSKETQRGIKAELINPVLVG